ncbi:MAG: hypothetical protein AAGC81_07400, partial [Pseudomonadota bacterium]
ELNEVGINLDKIAEKLSERHQKLLDSQFENEASTLKLDRASDLIKEARKEIAGLKAEHQELSDVKESQSV